MRIYSIFCLFTLMLFSCDSLQQKDAIAKIEAIKKTIEQPNTTINDSILNMAINSMNAYAKKYPKDTLTPQYLFDAASIYRFMHNPAPALDIYKKIYNEYPNFSKHTECLFLQGMVLADEMNNKPEAEKIYNDFVSKYPNHFLTPDLKVLLSQFHMTDEELMKSFQKRNDSLEAIN